MSKKRTAKSRIVAASPMVHEPGVLPYRIVIRETRPSVLNLCFDFLTQF
jgi:hypothetical protein